MKLQEIRDNDTPVAPPPILTPPVLLRGAPVASWVIVDVELPACLTQTFLLALAQVLIGLLVLPRPWKKSSMSTAASKVWASYVTFFWIKLSFLLNALRPFSARSSNSLIWGSISSVRSALYCRTVPSSIRRKTFQLNKSHIIMLVQSRWHTLWLSRTLVIRGKSNVPFRSNCWASCAYQYFR
jgi:hypothetical protein